MRTPWDARRSLQRYAALVLGPTWEVALEADRDQQRSELFARVVPVSDMTTTGAPRWPELTQTFQIDCYAAKRDTVVEAEHEAFKVMDVMERAFSIGVGRGRPMRVPLYDFDGVPNEETSDVRDPRDFLQVVSFAARRLPDPEEPRNIAVIAEVRVRWRRVGRLPFDPVSNVVENVSTSVDNSGG